MKKVNLDLMVGLFVVAGFLAFVYMSVQLGEFSPFAVKDQYTVVAEFSNVSGLKRGAVVEIAGVPVGKVAAIDLDDTDRALVTMYINRGVAVSEDAIASIKTQGIIGDKYIRISPGGSDVVMADGGRLMETESALDIEELVSKYVFGGV